MKSKSGKMALGRKLVLGAAVSACLCIASWFILLALDEAYPPPIAQGSDLSVEVLDRDGDLLRAFANRHGRWRLAVALDDVDPNFRKLLIAYEDKRFFRHHGVDPFAILRAAGQFIANGRIVSGGSTVTMQLARLLEPRQSRSVAAKLRQMARAIQLERRLSKEEILTQYLTLAPYGGNLEGVRAASLSWFAREPAHLTLAQAALLVALPQSPEARRPDRNHQAALRARGRVLERAAKTDILAKADAERIASIRVPTVKRALPDYAAHLARVAVDRDPTARFHHTNVERRAQQRLEGLARKSARRAGTGLSVAILLADSRNGDILASVGSPDYSDASRGGWIDMTRAVRSPGSTLKPFIYGQAIEQGIVLPETWISDRPADFDGWRPANFDMLYQGDIPVRQALQQSLNVPAIRLLDAIGPNRLVARMRRAGVTPKFPIGEKPGLAMGLGGVGLSLHDLVQLYVNMANQSNRPLSIGDGIRELPGQLPGRRMINRVASWHVSDMLSGIPEPAGSQPRRIAYKTGTSYGYRDAWAVGYDGRYVIGVWVGRTDNGAVPGISGGSTAAPILFEAFERSGKQHADLPKAPAGAVRLAHSDLPQALRVFGQAGEIPFVNARQGHSRLAIAFPRSGSQLELGTTYSGGVLPVTVKLQGGVPPFRLMENGRPAKKGTRRRALQWQPKGNGWHRLTIVDAIGRTDSIQIMVR